MPLSRHRASISNYEPLVIQPQGSSRRHRRDAGVSVNPSLTVGPHAAGVLWNAALCAALVRGTTHIQTQQPCPRNPKAPQSGALQSASRKEYMGILVFDAAVAASGVHRSLWIAYDTAPCTHCHQRRCFSSGNPNCSPSSPHASNSRLSRCRTLPYTRTTVIRPGEKL